jgi:Ala-tRNA(Pro) deacylase
MQRSGGGQRPRRAAAPARSPSAPGGPVTAMGRGAYPRYARFPGEMRGGVMTQVTEHLESRGVPFEPIAHRQAYTSIDEARALGIEASEVVKTVAVRVAGDYALMAVPATCRLDMPLVRAAVGDRHVRLATEEELRRDFPDFELGALPPLGLLLGASLYVDQEVLQHETVVFAAGSRTESVQLKTADLLQHEQVTALPLIRHADEDDKDWLP